MSGRMDECATTLMKCLVRYALCSKRIIEKHRLSTEAFEWLIGKSIYSNGCCSFVVSSYDILLAALIISKNLFSAQKFYAENYKLMRLHKAIL